MTTFHRNRFIVCLLSVIVLGVIGTAIAANDAQVQQLRQTGKCTLCDLSGAQLNGARLEGADLTGANLFEAQMYGANLKGAKLAGAILQSADLKMADLTGATDAALAGAQTDEHTTCPNGERGPCQ